MSRALHRAVRILKDRSRDGQHVLSDHAHSDCTKFKQCSCSARVSLHCVTYDAQTPMTRRLVLQNRNPRSYASRKYASRTPIVALAAAKNGIDKTRHE